MRNIYRRAITATRLGLEPQPRGKLDDAAAPDHEPDIDDKEKFQVNVRKWQRQISDIIARVKEIINPKQTLALEIILSNFNQGNVPLTQTEIGKQLKAPTPNAQRVGGFRAVTGIRHAIRQVADEMGPEYEDAARIIDFLVAPNKKDLAIE
jgi:hypothetical protein